MILSLSLRKASGTVAAAELVIIGLEVTALSEDVLAAQRSGGFRGLMLLPLEVNAVEEDTDAVRVDSGIAVGVVAAAAGSNRAAVAADATAATALLG